MATYQASCLCQAVNFKLTGEPFRFAVCHCSNCKVAGGSAFMTNAFFKSQVSMGATQKGIPYLADMDYPYPEHEGYERPG